MSCKSPVKMRAVFVLLLAIAIASALPAQDANRIVGGSVTTIDQYPFGVALLTSSTGILFVHSCGGTIINNRSILTAATCVKEDVSAWHLRNRVGSSYASSGGTVYNSDQIIIHPNYNSIDSDMDIAIIRISGFFTLNGQVSPGSIAGANYNIDDNQVVWTFGWGSTCRDNCANSEQLRHVQVWTVNQNICRMNYNDIAIGITDNMLCSGWLDVGGRDQCSDDTGGPLLHNNVVVGVSSFGQCGLPRYPGVNARVPVASEWIVSNA